MRIAQLQNGRWVIEHWTERRVAGKLKPKRTRKRARMPKTWIAHDVIRMRG